MAIDIVSEVLLIKRHDIVMAMAHNAIVTMDTPSALSLGLEIAYNILCRNVMARCTTDQNKHPSVYTP